MSEWRGLANPERHRVEASGLTSCRNCANTGCSQVCPCYCCLAAVVERLTAERDALAALCEQQTKDRSLYSDDREKYDLSYIDGWNDALDLVEQALRGES